MVAASRFRTVVVPLRRYSGAGAAAVIKNPTPVIPRTWPNRLIPLPAAGRAAGPPYGERS